MLTYMARLWPYVRPALWLGSLGKPAVIRQAFKGRPCGDTRKSEDRDVDDNLTLISRQVAGAVAEPSRMSSRKPTARAPGVSLSVPEWFAYMVMD